jgi:PAS domain S-box-containing protein
LVHIADLKEGEVYQTSPLRQALVDLGGARTGIIVALRKDETLLGVLTMYRQEIRRFTDKQIALLQNFAAQAVIAMENARLLGELRQRTQELTRRETASRNREERYALAMRAINEGVYEWDVATSEMYYSPRVCELVGLQASELRTMRDWTDRIHPDDREAFKKAILAHFKGETDRLEAEYRYRHADGSWHWAWQHDIALKNKAGRAYRVVGSTGDITDRKAAEQALQEALEQQTATAEVLQVINTSPGELAPVFDAMLEKAMRLCEAAFGALRTYDGNSFRAVAVHGVPEPFAEFYAHNPPSYGPGTGPARILSGEPFVHVADLASEEAYLAGEPNRRALVDLGGARTSLAVPLRKGDALLGFILIYRQEVRPFSDKQIALLQNFAAQAVIAMENARLLTETREALEQQTATAEVLGVINSSPGNLAPVFDAMIEKATRLCEAPFGILRTWDGERFHFGAVHGEPTFRNWLRQRGPTRPDRDASPLGRIQAGERVVRFADEPGDEGYWNSAGFREMVDASGIRRGIWVALRKDDELLGTITVFRREPRPFSEKQIALLENFAAQAVIAMENARLINETRERTEEVAELNRGLEARVAEQVDELGRVGRLKRFLAPQLAELIVSHGDEKILESHRREIVVVFCDLRGYTAFTETAEPEEVLDFLREYHGALGRSSASSRVRLISSQAMGSWFSSTILSRSLTRPSAPSRWPSRCARRLAR